MIVIKPLKDKIRSMAAEVGEETLDAQTDHYYERGVLDDFLQSDEISIGEACEVVPYLRSLLNQRQEARP